jgi:hypothetical protein
VPPPPALFVEGVVRDAQGTAVRDLIVRATAYAGTCTAADSITPVTSVSNAATNAVGRFQLSLASGVETTTTCLRLLTLRTSSTIGAPPTQLGLREIAGVRLRGPTSTAKLDSVSVTLTVP